MNPNQRGVKEKFGGVIAIRDAEIAIEREPLGHRER